MSAYTAATLKDYLNRKGDQSGFAFDAFGPYFANSERLSAMKKAFNTLLETDNCRDKSVKRLTPRTINSINRWFGFLANRYGV